MELEKTQERERKQANIFLSSLQNAKA